MRRRPKLLRILTTGAIGAAALTMLTACDKTVHAQSDSYTCIFTSANRGEKLVGQVSPGGNSFSGNSSDIAVTIPTSNRFYLASTDDAKRDALNDKFYKGYAIGQIPVDVQGQVNFKFNVNKACDWYIKSGKRDAGPNNDLGFNVRGTDQVQAGWFQYLSENFAQTLERDVPVVARNYTWAQLNYNYPLNADPISGVLPTGQAAGIGAAQDFGEKLGILFTQDLSQLIGGQYFCGTQTSDPLTSKPVTDACPPILFTTSTVTPEDSTLVTAQQALEIAKQTSQQAVAQAELLQKTKASTLAAEAAQQEIYAAQLKTQQLKTQLDPTVSKCLLYAAAGDGCDGSRPSTYAGTTAPSK